MLAYAYDVLTEVSAPVGRDAGGGRREAGGGGQKASGRSGLDVEQGVARSRKIIDST